MDLNNDTFRFYKRVFWLIIIVLYIIVAFNPPLWLTTALVVLGGLFVSYPLYLVIMQKKKGLIITCVLMSLCYVANCWVYFTLNVNHFNVLG